MALQITTKLNTTHGIELENAYVHIREANYNKEQGKLAIAIRTYSSREACKNGCSSFKVDNYPAVISIDAKPDEIGVLFQFAYAKVKEMLDEKEIFYQDVLDDEEDES